MRDAMPKKRLPKMPTSVRIGHLTYQIGYRTQLSTDGGGNADDCGQCRASDLSILVRSTLPDEQQRSTLFHEVLHAVSNVYAAGLKEQQVLALEVGLLTLLRDNPALLAAVLPR